MPKLINWIAPFLPNKIAIINLLLGTMPESTREDVIGKVIAKQIPDFHLKLRPYKLHPKKDNSYSSEMDRATKHMDKYKGY